MQLRYYHIWAEGFSTPEGSAKAECLTERPILASTFNKAVLEFGKEYPEHDIIWNHRLRYKSNEAYRNRRARYSTHERDIFPDERSARELYG